MADPPPPHPAVWTSQMLVLGVVVFSVSYGLGSTLFKQTAQADEEEGDAEDDDDER